MKTRRSVALATALCATLGLVVPLTFSSAAQAAPPDGYDAIGTDVPSNVPSVGFEATSTNEFGDLVEIASGSRVLDDVTVLMSSWGCESGGWNTNDCSTSANATFEHDLTITLYRVDRTGAVPAPGQVIATDTSTFDIPYRPSADADCAGGRWQDTAGDCFNGLATPVTFDFPADTVLPEELIWGMSYNTTHRGYAPIGEAAPCYTESGGCGYDSLNVGVESLPGQPSAGADPDEDVAFINGGAGFIQDTGWTGFRPLARITTDDVPVTSTTVVVNEQNAHGWQFACDNVVPNCGGSGEFVTGPATPPLGAGSGELQVDSTGRWVLAAAIAQGTRLDQFTSMGFSTYRASPDAGNLLSIALQFNWDADLTDANEAFQSRLVFEPYFTAGSGNIAEDTWYDWSPMDGNWWLPSAVGLCSQSDPCSWGELLQKYPDGGVHNTLGAVILKAGGPWAGGFEGNVDAVRLGVLDGGQITQTTYDFEHFVYDFSGFFQPVDNNNANVAKAGQTIPVKWRLTQGGDPVSDPSSFVSLTSRQVNCTTVADLGTDQIEAYTNASGLLYHGDGNWQFNWKTPKSYAGQCRIMTVTLLDGSTKTAFFQFK